VNPTSILIESYLAGQQLIADERAFQLLRLDEVATRLSQPSAGRGPRNFFG